MFYLGQDRPQAAPGPGHSGCCSTVTEPLWRARAVQSCAELWTLSIYIAEELSALETPAGVGDRTTKVVIGCAE